MNEFLKKLQPVDLIAIFTLAGGLILRGLGIDGLVGTILITIVLFYFGKKEIVDKIGSKKLPEAKRETVEEIIKRVAKEEGVSIALAIKVAKCESGLDPGAKNINPKGSIDRGLYQWNNHWHPEITDECAYDPECATRAYCKAYKNGNLSWWNASRKCWEK